MAGGLQESTVLFPGDVSIVSWRSCTSPGIDQTSALLSRQSDTVVTPSPSKSAST